MKNPDLTVGVSPEFKLRLCRILPALVFKVPLDHRLIHPPVETKYPPDQIHSVPQSPFRRKGHVAFNRLLVFAGSLLKACSFVQETV